MLAAAIGEAGVFKLSSVRPLNVGAGRGGRTGEEPPSAVEVLEKAGDPGCCCDAGKSSNPSSAAAAGGGDEGREGIVAHERPRRRSSSRLLRGLWPSQHDSSFSGGVAGVEAHGAIAR